jgi:hypothetical protein
MLAITKNHMMVVMQGAAKIISSIYSKSNIRQAQIKVFRLFKVKLPTILLSNIILAQRQSKMLTYLMNLCKSVT